MDKVYKVVLDLGTTGTLGSGGLERSTKQAEKFDGSLAKVKDQLLDMGSGVTTAFTGAVERVGALVAGVGMLAGGLGVAAVVHGVVHLNNQLESTRISLAAIFQANNQAGSFSEGMELAADSMKQIRKDAKALPGETADLIQIFRNISIPAFQSGKDIAQTEKMSAKFMAFGAVSGLQMDTVAREAAMLLEGRAGAHNMLGLRLAGLGGDKAKEFNQKSAADRFTFLSKELDKYSDSIQGYSHSFDGLSSTFMDNAKNFLRMATAPLFERVKMTLERINGWFDANETRIERWAQQIGDKLGEAFDWALQKIEEWAPAVQKFGLDAFHALSQMWDKFGPTIGEAANALKGALSDGTALSKIEDILKLYALTKVGTPILGGMGAAGKFGGSLMEAAGAGGPAGMAVGAGVAIEAGLALLALAGAAHAAADSTSEYHDRATAGFSRLSTQWDRLSATLNTNLMPALEHFGVVVLESVVANLDLFNTALDWATHPMNGLAVSADWLANAIGPDGHVGMALTGFADMLDANRRLNDTSDANTKEMNDDIRGRRGGDFSMPGRGTAWGGAIAQEVKKALLPPGMGGGHGGTTVQKVEIVVSSNQDPGRIAEFVYDKLVTLNKHPKVVGTRFDR